MQLSVSFAILQKELPEDGPELEAAKEKRKEWDREAPNIEGVFSSTGVIEPIHIRVDEDEADVDNVLKQSVDKIESKYRDWCLFVEERSI